MDIQMISLDTLIKLLNLTTSPVDAERLAAIHHANAMLTRAGCTWETLLSQTKLVNLSRASNDDIDTINWAVYIDRLLPLVMSDASRQWLHKLKDYFETKGFLSERQIEIVLNIEMRARRR
jgi:hypothetical protein